MAAWATVVVDDSAEVERVDEGAGAALVDVGATVVAEASLDDGAVPQPAAAIASAAMRARASAARIGPTHIGTPAGFGVNSTHP